MSSAAESLIQSAFAFASEPHRIFVNGEWLDAANSERIDVFNPSTGEVIGSIPNANKDEVDTAVRAARACFENDWSRRDAAARSQVLRNMIRLLDEHRDILALLETIDVGTPYRLTREMVVDSWIAALDYFAGATARIAGQTFTPPAGWDYMAEHGSALYTLREPVGVVGAILPWNAPASFYINKIGPALAAGCTLVIKPPEQAPLTSIYLTRLFEEAGLPNGALNLVTGLGQTTGQAIAQHPDVDKITFTGSTAVGRSIMRDGAENFKRLTLELGGKSSFVVMRDADMDKAIQFLVMMGIHSAGQFCMCPSKVFVEKDILDVFTNQLNDALGQVAIGPAIDTNTQMGPLISLQQRARVSDLVEGAKAEGVEVLRGGAQINETGGYHYQPTLLFKGDTNLTIAQEEIFGPVLLTTPFDQNDLDALTSLANETRYGLAASVWTRDLSLANTMVKRFQAGIVGINSHGFVDPRAPFGGVKHSGLGREFGEEGLDAFLETKMVSALY